MEKNTLKEEANRILDELQLMQYLSGLGTPKVVGSVALDLIVKLDLDIHLLLPHPNLFAAVNEITEYLLDHPKIREVRITDWRVSGGLKIGVDVYPEASGDWSIDIWVTDQIATTAFDLVPELLQKLTPETRRTIMQIKEHYYSKGELRDGLSLKIYRAVLDAGVRSVEDFEALNI